MLIFLDLETTGLERTDKVVSIALIVVDDMQTRIFSQLLNEGKKIPPKASSIHHITNEMIEKKPKFKESDIYSFLQHNNTQENTLIAHNVNFDLQMLSRTGIEWRGDVVDTLRVTKHLIPECEYFSLQYLRYELKLYKKESTLTQLRGVHIPLQAHDALGDCAVVKLLYEYLLQMVSLEKMRELTFENVLLEKLEFGKYAGKYIEEIAINDRGYLEWMLHSIMDLDEDLRYSITYYLQGQS